MRKAVFAGSFDPITLGHEDLVRRSLSLFDTVVVAVGANSDKHGMFSVDQRLEWIKATFADCANVEVAQYEGLTVDFCNAIGARYLLRGVRNVMDMAYEQQIADLNRRIAPSIETVLLMPRPDLADVSSSAVRELLRYGKPIDGLVPPCVDIRI